MHQAKTHLSRLIEGTVEVETVVVGSTGAGYRGGWWPPAGPPGREGKRVRRLLLQVPDDWLEAVGCARFVELPLRGSRAALAGRRAWHHRDPFDRMPVAQPLVENFRLVTRDRLAVAYGVTVLEA